MSGKTVRDAIADWIHFEASIQNGFENSRGRSVNDHADDILSAILSAGFAVVPVEPTEAMVTTDHLPLTRLTRRRCKNLPARQPIASGRKSADHHTNAPGVSNEQRPPGQAYLPLLSQAHGQCAGIESPHQQPEASGGQEDDKARGQGGKGRNADIPPGAEAMTDIVKGMARAYVEAWDLLGVELEPSDRMRAALLWLADNVSDKMAHHAASQYFDKPLNEANPPRILVEFGGIISAAIRAAAGEEGK